MRPKILKDAAAKHNLFLAEDGSVLEIFDEEQKPKKKRGKKDDGEENGKKVEADSKKVRGNMQANCVSNLTAGFLTL